MIPLMLRLHIQKKDRRGINLWLPFFLIWLIALPLLVIFAPVLLLAALILWPTGKGKYILFLYLTIFNFIWHMSGLRIHIESGDSIIYLNLI
jgi:hypothetical protein